MTESPCSAFEAPSRYPSFLICLLFHLFLCLSMFFWMPCLLVSHCLLLCYLPLFHLPWLPLFCRSPCLSASCYCNHLFTQPVAHLPTPVSYSLILSDFITLTQEKALLFSLVTTASNSDRVFLCVSELWRVQCSVHVCTCEPALHKLKRKKKTLSICYAFLTLTYTYKYSPL